MVAMVIPPSTEPIPWMNFNALLPMLVSAEPVYAVTMAFHSVYL
jgi:hypothetical protein